MKKHFVILLQTILFFGLINAQESVDAQVLINDVTKDFETTKVSDTNYFDNSEIASIVEIIKSGDAYALEYAFASSEKKLKDFQQKYLLDMVDSSIDKLSKKTISDKNLKQIAAIAAGVASIIYLEKTNYLKDAGMGHKSGLRNEPTSKVMSDKFISIIATLLTPLRQASGKTRSNVIKPIIEKFYSPKTGIFGVSNYKAYLENLLGDGISKQIVVSLIIMISGKLIIDAIYATSGTINSKVSDILLYRKYLNKMCKIKEVILKQKVSIIS